MANTTTAEISHGVDAYYDRNLLTRAYPSFVHTRFAQVRDIPRGNTGTIRFRKYASLSAATTALTEGVTPAGSQLSKTDITALPLQYGDYVTMTDKLQFETLDPLLVETSAILGDQAGDTLDQLARDVIAAGSTVQYASTATQRTEVAAGMTLNGSEVREMVRTLTTNNAKPIKSQVDPSTGFNTSPIHASFVGIAHPKTIFDLKQDPDWVPVEEYASQGDVMPGEQGKLDSVRFIETSNAKVFTAGGADSIDVYGTVILGQEAYGISRISGEAMRTITKPLGSAGTADPLDQRSTMGWKANFVAKRLQEAFMGRIEHAVSA